MGSPRSWRGREVREVPVLVGEGVRLEPLGVEHAADLRLAGASPEIWRYQIEAPGPFETDERVVAWVERAVADWREGIRLPFAVVSEATGRAIGSTGCYFETRWPNLTLEVGGTWLAVEHWGSPVNAVCKRLLLGYAFDEIGAERVEFLVDVRNVRSQRALERIGVQREGVFRAHMRCADGHLRDSVGYGVLRAEWPEVRRAIEARLARG